MNAITGGGLEVLLAEWNRQWAPSRPVAHELRSVHPDRWVRFHSLPESKRYADSDEEWQILLDRHYRVLGELFASSDILIFTCAWSSTKAPPTRTDFDMRINPDGQHWTSLLTEDDPDPDFRVFTHLYTGRTRWQPGSLDPVLRAAASWETAGIMISDCGLTRIYHPYDGGADVLLATGFERDELRDRHTDWLSSHPGGM